MILGSFGEVYKGYQKSNNKKIAIKKINYEKNEEIIKTIIQEINILKSLDHPNLIKVHYT